ncbi:MAG: hypothetical protein JWO92_2479 [Chitinophagaceae bacterium]|nr:hypothetical protein [Chitinophagaceae bacterium]
MAENKTIETNTSVDTFIKTIPDEKKRKDFSEIISLFKKQSGYKPKMWGNAIIGFGSYHYKYESGREGDAPVIALSPRAKSITLYLGSEFEKREELLSKFGKHKLSGGCIHIQKLEDIDKSILLTMIKNSIQHRKDHLSY